jgi:hypothetical protein
MNGEFINKFTAPVSSFKEFRPPIFLRIDILDTDFKDPGTNFLMVTH